jgi:hypothetical protein
LGDGSLGMLPKHLQFPGSWVGTEHCLKSALVWYTIYIKPQEFKMHVDDVAGSGP